MDRLKDKQLEALLKPYTNADYVVTEGAIIVANAQRLKDLEWMIEWLEENTVVTTGGFGSLYRMIKPNSYQSLKDKLKELKG